MWRGRLSPAYLLALNRVAGVMRLPPLCSILVLLGHLSMVQFPPTQRYGSVGNRRGKKGYKRRANKHSLTRSRREKVKQNSLSFGIRSGATSAAASRELLYRGDVRRKDKRIFYSRLFWRRFALLAAVSVGRRQ